MSTRRAGSFAALEIAIAAPIGIAAGLAVGFVGEWALEPLVSWDVGCVIYLGLIWRTVWRLDADETRRHAARVDPRRRTADLLMLGASVSSLVAVGFVLGRAGHSEGSEKWLLAALGLASVVLSWTVVHTTYTVRYAHLYYTGRAGGVNFNSDAAPRYSDFAYLSFTIGMTFQVSDTALESSDLRRPALRQALLSYVFGTGILATTVNLIAGLGH